MNKRSKLAALLGAGLLTFGVASVALADTLNGSFVDVKASDMTQGTETDCANQFPNLAEGQVGYFFVLGGADQGDGAIHVVSSDGTVDLANSTDSQGSALRWAVTIDGATGDTTLTAETNTDATSNANGDDHLVVSHVCISAPGGGGGGESDVPTQPSTDSIGSTGSSGPSDTAWLLVVALGVLLASVVVLTPARAKGRR